MIARLVLRLYPHFAIISDIAFHWMFANCADVKYEFARGYPTLGR